MKKNIFLTSISMFIFFSTSCTSNESFPINDDFQVSFELSEKILKQNSLVTFEGVLRNVSNKSYTISHSSPLINYNITNLSGEVVHKGSPTFLVNSENLLSHGESYKPSLCWKRFINSTIDPISYFLSY